MRTITQIQNDLNAQIVALKAIDAKDTEALEAGTKALKDLEVELKAAAAAEEAERKLVREHIDGEAKKGNTFSLARFIAGAANGRLEGFEAEIAEAGADEYRRLGLSQHGFVIPSSMLRTSGSGSGSGNAPAGQNWGVNADGGYLVEQKNRYIEDVKEKLVVVKMGATILNDLVGTINLPSVGSVQATFLDEAAMAQTKKATVARVQLIPRGIRANMVTTRDLLKQTSLDVERVLASRLSDAAAACIDKTALAAIATAVASASGNGVTWANIVAMETAINAANANRGKMGYIVSANAWGAAKTTLKASGVAGYILDGNSFINGYAADYSNQMPDGVPAIFGNFEDLYIGQWGGLDILVDPFTMGDSGEIKIQLFQYADVKVGFAKSFAKLAAAGSGSGSGSGSGASA